ncbi:MAG: carboxypeptidase-like regulatory domain-containing protein, partial [Bacteroidales bacterium]|nr:carboxypeptidase-like regulatory domain-containing protein [Bacteroidales bacterium]
MYQKISLWLLFSLLILSINAKAQQGIKFIEGNVSETNSDGQTIPLVGANVFWLGSLQGAVTDANGNFRIETLNNIKSLVISYVGYQNDTINVVDNSFIQVNLESSVSLGEVQVVHRRKSTELSMF